MTPRCWRCAASPAPCDLCSDRRIRARVASPAICPCGAPATTREGGRDRCSPCTAERLRAVARQASARRRAVDGRDGLGVIASVGVVWLAAAVAWVLT